MEIIKKIAKAGFLIFCGVIIFAAGGIYSQESDTARVFSVRGDARVIPLGSNVGVQCQEGMLINPGDWIRTGENSSVTFAFDHDADNVVRVQENSLVIMRLDGYFKVQLLKGKVNAILENVQHGEKFRVLTPSVVTESASSGWMVSAEGEYSTVVVVEGEAYVLGVNKDGSIRKDRYKIEEGLARTTRMHEDPGEPTAAPDGVMDWFREQVVEHHLAQKAAEKAGSEPDASVGSGRRSPGTENELTSAQEQVIEESFSEGAGRGQGRSIAIVDGEEVDILEYIYKRRLHRLGE